MTEQDLKTYFDNISLDARNFNDARFMDQKCTPDVLSAVSECVLEFSKNDNDIEFTKSDIWNFDYSKQLIPDIFSKPGTDEQSAEKEYDKFFSQPCKLWSYAGVLDVKKVGGENVYRIKKRNILDYISKRERNALFFLEAYANKLVDDNGLRLSFDRFFTSQDTTALRNLMRDIKLFYYERTNVKNKFEPSRIFNKILNILAFQRKAKGETRGVVSKRIITIDDLRYNQVNWRDIDKDKSMTRQQYAETIMNQVESESKTGLFNYRVKKAIDLVKQIEPYSETHRFPAYPAQYAHHIFMKSQFPEIADYIENLIVLTPNQHYGYAHPQGDTHVINQDYQIVCLLCKLESIEINRRNGLDDYSLEDFIKVLNIGLDTDVFNPQMSYEEVKYGIIKNAYYHEALSLR